RTFSGWPYPSGGMRASSAMWIPGTWPRPRRSSSLKLASAAAIRLHVPTPSSQAGMKWANMSTKSKGMAAAAVISSRSAFSAAGTRPTGILTASRISSRTARSASREPKVRLVARWVMFRCTLMASAPPSSAARAISTLLAGRATISPKRRPSSSCKKRLIIHSPSRSSSLARFGHQEDGRLLRQAGQLRLNHGQDEVFIRNAREIHNPGAHQNEEVRQDPPGVLNGRTLFQDELGRVTSFARGAPSHHGVGQLQADDPLLVTHLHPLLPLLEEPEELAPLHRVAEGLQPLAAAQVLHLILGHPQALGDHRPALIHTQLDPAARPRPQLGGACPHGPDQVLVGD